MSRILITSGPTRQHLDPVRYLTNASSGRMGAALAEAAVEAGHQVAIVSGPVDVSYPAAARVIPVVSTEEMLAACLREFPACDGLIAVAAPCDYRPVAVAPRKIRKTGNPLMLKLVETSDIVAEVAASRQAATGGRAPHKAAAGGRAPWIVAFALETEDRHMRAMQKLERKSCDLIVVNGPQAMHAADTRVEILDQRGQVLGNFAGGKTDVAKQILRVIDQQLIHPTVTVHRP
jgi:phosphopantothenoylcysteine decarboxylase/phosphopantothenate--cysteine ligase